MISVIVPVYKAEKYLHRCVDSILAQSYTDFELLLIDDGSPDNCGAICDEYAQMDSRVRVFHKENGGVSSARNLGLDNARGEYVTFCDSDDRVAFNWLSVYENAMKNEVDIAIQGICCLDQLGVKIKDLFPPDEKDGSEKRNKRDLIVSLKKQCIFGYTVIMLFRKAIIDKYGICFDEKSRIWEDGQFIAKFLEYVSSFVCIENIGYYYYTPLANKTYNGASGYSVYHILKSFDLIFDGDIPRELLFYYFHIFRDYMVTNIINGTLLSPDCFDLYNRIAPVEGCKGRAINYLIKNSEKKYSLSPFILRVIHKLTAR